MSEQQYDVVIVGAGMVGLTLAHLLRASDLKIAVIDNQPEVEVSDDIDLRVSALSYASVQLFKRLDVWSSIINARAGIYHHMHVWDATGAGEIHFDTADVGLEYLGYIVENSVTQHALAASLKQPSALDFFQPQVIEKILLDDDVQRVHLQNGDILSCKLIIGADGANSLVRQSAAINYERHSYEQQAIVCHVATEYPHNETAWQCFLPEGPLAFLPLYNGESSIVWSCEENSAEALLQLSDDQFMHALAEAFQYRLGDILSVSKRARFPLAHGHAEQYVQQGLALVGDAAHTIHPLAGQGVNLGIQDAMSLANVIITARQNHRQWWASHTLRAYERERKGANWVMETSMTGFKQLFSNDNPWLSLLRNAGLNAVDQMPAVKKRFMLAAAGMDNVLSGQIHT